jgi:hypothetical protein
MKKPPKKLLEQVSNVIRKKKDSHTVDDDFNSKVILWEDRQ